MDVRFVADVSTLDATLELMPEPVVGIDVERADGQRYFKAAALVQVGTAECCMLVDAVQLGELGPLDRFLAGRLAVFHALENDLAPLATLQVEPTRVADTAVAAALLGLPTGLRPLLGEVLGVRLNSDKERLQRADWSARPLTQEMVAYAAEDVLHLAPLWAELERRLNDAGRLTWYEQELAAVIDRARDERSWTRTKGLGRLDQRGRGVLRAVWEEREAIARGEDVAPQRIARDESLVSIAENPPQSLAELPQRGLRALQVDCYGQRLLAAVRHGFRGSDEPAQPGLRPSRNEDRATYDRLRRARAQVAERVGIASGVLCPSRLLWRAVLSDPQDGTELCALAGLRPWQTQLLAQVLWNAYAKDEPEAATDSGH